MTNKPIVLIIDDDSDLLEELTSDLEKDYEVATACTELQAVDLLSPPYPNVVLLDLSLTENQAEGLQICKDIVANTPWIPVIMISAYAKTQQVVEALGLGSVEFLDKPLVSHKLKAALARALSGRTRGAKLETIRQCLNFPVLGDVTVSVSLRSVVVKNKKHDTRNNSVLVTLTDGIEEISALVLEQDNSDIWQVATTLSKRTIVSIEAVLTSVSGQNVLQLHSIGVALQPTQEAKDFEAAMKTAEKQQKDAARQLHLVTLRNTVVTLLQSHEFTEILPFYLAQFQPGDSCLEVGSLSGLPLFQLAHSPGLQMRELLETTAQSQLFCVTNLFSRSLYEAQWISRQNDKEKERTSLSLPESVAVCGIIRESTRKYLMELCSRLMASLLKQSYSTPYSTQPIVPDVGLSQGVFSFQYRLQAASRYEQIDTVIAEGHLDPKNAPLPVGAFTIYLDRIARILYPEA